MRAAAAMAVAMQLFLSLVLVVVEAFPLYVEGVSSSPRSQLQVKGKHDQLRDPDYRFGFAFPSVLPQRGLIPRRTPISENRAQVTSRRAQSSCVLRRQHRNMLGAMAMSADASGRGSMKWSSSVSLGFGSLIETVEEAANKCRESLGEGANIDLAMCFISDRFFERRGSQEPSTEKDLREVIEFLKKKLRAKHVIGCLSPGVIGMGEEESPEEFEQVKAVSVSAACLPNVNVRIQRVAAGDVPDNDSLEDWRKLVGSPELEDRPVFLLFSEHNFPGRGNINRFLEGLDFAYPGCTKVGGLTARFKQDVELASTVFGDVELSRDKAASPGIWVVSLTGDIEAEAIVAQGCRPIGPEFEVSKTKGNKVFEVFDPLKKDVPMTSLAALSKVIEALSPADLELAQRALFVGVESNSMSLSELKQPNKSGDVQEEQKKEYLLRPVILVSANDKSMLVGDVLRPGQRIRLHVPDRTSAMAEVEALMSSYKRQRLTELMMGSSSNPAAGLVLFSCIGRGRPLFGEPNYESKMASMATGVPVVGCFYNGEFGPAGGQASLHEYTSVFTIFRNKKAGQVAPEVKLRDQEGEQNNSGK